MKTVCTFTAMLLAAVLALAAPASALSPTQLKNATYQGIYEDAVELSDGRYDGEPFAKGDASHPSVTLLDALTASGDLNGNGIEDAAVVLLEDSGGSGSFSYLAVVLDRDGEPVNQSTILLGDRVSLKSVAIEDGRILVDFIEQNNVVQKAYQFILAESGSETLGAVSVSDLEGVDWVLVPEQRLVAGTEITATFADGKIGGASSCNRYSANVTDQGAGKIAIGPTMGTRKACPREIMKQEHAFLAALGSVAQFSFSGGQLLLMHGDGVLRFAPPSPETGTVSLLELEGTSWMLEELESGQELVPETEITIEFADGKISGSNGCNTYSVDITEDDSHTLNVGQAIGTMMACSDEIMKQEHVFMTTLEGVTQARLSAGRLELLHEGGTLIFTKRAE